MKTDYFISLIMQLRKQENIILYANLLDFEEEETQRVTTFLRSEYANECLEFPFDAPSFSPSAAIWAAKAVYITAQLILYRENKGVELPNILNDFPETIDPSAVLSADLCLRFIPDMLAELKAIDQEDPLIALLENLLYKWHYSGVKYALESGILDFSIISSSMCLKQLYCNRVTENKKLNLAKLPELKGLISVNLGLYDQLLWSDFKTEMRINETN